MGDDWPRDSGAAVAMNWRGYIGRRARLLVLAAAGVTLLGLLGNHNWRLELFSHFVAWYALWMVPVLGALVWARSWPWAGGALLVVLINAFQPLMWYGPTVGPPQPDGLSCRILLANVLTSNKNSTDILALIEATDPDVICLQEINSRWAEDLALLHKNYPHYHEIPRGDNFGIALYSRISPGLPEALFQDALGVPALTIPIEKDGVRAQLLTIHTLPPLQQRMANLRGDQLAAARDWYDDQEVPAIIVGDLNLTMYSPVYRRWMAGFDAKNARQGHGPLGSWPVFVPFMRLPLDHCLVSPEIEVVDCRLGPDIGSDHLPLIIDLRLPR